MPVDVSKIPAENVSHLRWLAVQNNDECRYECYRLLVNRHKVKPRDAMWFIIERNFIRHEDLKSKSSTWYKEEAVIYVRTRIGGETFELSEPFEKIVGRTVYIYHNRMELVSSRDVDEISRDDYMMTVQHYYEYIKVHEIELHNAIMTEPTNPGLRESLATIMQLHHDGQCTFHLLQYPVTIARVSETFEERCNRITWKPYRIYTIEFEGQKTMLLADAGWNRKQMGKEIHRRMSPMISGMTVRE